MKTVIKKITAVALVIVVAFGVFVSICGLGSIPSLSEALDYGLDINGGVYVLLEAELEDDDTDVSDIMDEIKTVLENRVDALGISGATVSIEGTNRVRVEMPGVDDAEEAIEQIGQTAQLCFYLSDGTLVLTGDYISDAGFSTDSENGGYKITIEFTSEGQELFAAATEMASSGEVESAITGIDDTAIMIVLDDEIISAPTVSETIDSDTCEITTTGGFSQSEASELAALIKGGALPATLTEISSSVETATIGIDALEKSVIAGAIGLALVFLVMLIIYGCAGLIADFALIIYVLIVLWLMALTGSVLTLPGIAGIILSIGMAVDSNVIIFTRIREEIKKGKSVRVAADMGYKAARSTVLDAQLTTLIAAVVIYMLGSSSVKGFAFTLMIGTICSIFTAVFITQLFISLVAESSHFSKPFFFGLKENGDSFISFKIKEFDFIKHRKKFFAVSAIVIIIGLGFGLVKGLNYGIDFTGGTMLQLEMGEEVDTDEIKELIADYDLDPTIIYAGDDNTQIIIKTIVALDNDERAEIVDVIAEAYDLEDDIVLASEEFGPTVGNELKQNAVRAVIIAALCMLIYIRFRFKTWKFGISALFGLLHDVLITLSIYAIFGFTVNNPFIAGILTVVGYSINDTIVIFDRIRENGKFFKRKQQIELINTSLNQTLSRSLVTSLTTLIVMIPLFVMASSELREFLIPLIIGVLVGTYSSIFLCSPLYYELTRKENMSNYEVAQEGREKQRKKEEKAKSRAEKKNTNKK